MNGDRALRLARSPSILIASIGGLIVVMLLDRLLAGPAGIPMLSFAAGYIAAWVALFGVTIRWWAVPAVVVLIAGCLAVFAETSVAVVLALATLIVGTALGIVLRSLGVQMRRPVDPFLIALASGLAGLLLGMVSELGGGYDLPAGLAFAATCASVTLGSTLILPLVLAFRPGRQIPHQTEFTGLAVVAMVVAVAAMPLVRDWYGRVDVGILAWMALPLLLLVGWRYGVFATALSLWLVAVLAVVPVLGLAPPQGPAQVQRQGAGLLLMVVTLSVVLLVQRQREALSRLRSQEGITSAFLANVDPIWYFKRMIDGQGHYVNLGGGPYRNRPDLANATDQELYGPELAHEIAEADRLVLDSDQSFVTIETLPMPDGTERTTLSDRFPIRDASGRLIGIGGLRTDITQREEEAATARAQTARLRAMFERSPVPTLRVSVDSDAVVRIAAANEAFGRVVGRPSEGLVGSPLQERIVTGDWPRVAELFGRRTDRWSPQAEVGIHTRIGADRRMLVTVTPLTAQVGEGPDPIEYLLHAEDVTARRAAEDAVAWYSLFDVGTGLMNRTALGDRMDAALHRLDTSSGALALIVLDIDDFKAVNDTHGLVVGDRILTMVGERIRNSCTTSGAVARLGADEFAVLVEHESQDSVAVMVGRLQQALSVPLVVGDDPVVLSTTFGVAVTGDQDVSSGELVRQAELALFRAKRSGRGKVEFYAESMRAQALAVVNVRNELARAVRTDAFAVAYMPIVDLADGAVRGYEALVRLPAADGRLLMPSDFLEVARSAGLLTQMDRLVLRRALTDHSGGLLPVPGAGLSVNAEAEDLRDPDFAITILTELHAGSADPSVLTIEVTEAVLLQYSPNVMHNVSSLRDAGVKFAIDDFGTGYSSLSQLRQLNADVIKIDRSFVSGLDEDPEAGNIVATIIGLAHKLKLVAVAEGIETREQAETLRRMGCDRGQGYLFGRPQLLMSEPSPVAIPRVRDPGASERNH